jgi:hypothetical protein
MAHKGDDGLETLVFNRGMVSDSQWFVHNESGEPIGPVTTDLLVRGILAGKVPRDALIRRSDESAFRPWLEVGEVSSAVDAREASVPLLAPTPERPVQTPGSIPAAAETLRQVPGAELPAARGSMESVDMSADATHLMVRASDVAARVADLDAPSAPRLAGPVDVYGADAAEDVTLSKPTSPEGVSLLAHEAKGRALTPPPPAPFRRASEGRLPAVVPAARPTPPPATRMSQLAQLAAAPEGSRADDAKALPHVGVLPAASPSSPRAHPADATLDGPTLLTGVARAVAALGPASPDATLDAPALHAPRVEQVLHDAPIVGEEDLIETAESETQKAPTNEDSIATLPPRKVTVRKRADAPSREDLASLLEGIKGPSPGASSPAADKPRAHAISADATSEVSDHELVDVEPDPESMPKTVEALGEPVGALDALAEILTKPDPQESIQLPAQRIDTAPMPVRDTASVSLPSSASVRANVENPPVPSTLDVVTAPRADLAALVRAPSSAHRIASSPPPPPAPPPPPTLSAAEAMARQSAAQVGVPLAANAPTVSTLLSAGVPEPIRQLNAQLSAQPNALGVPRASAPPPAANASDAPHRPHTPPPSGPPSASFPVRPSFMGVQSSQNPAGGLSATPPPIEVGGQSAPPPPVQHQASPAPQDAPMARSPWPSTTSHAELRAPLPTVQVRRSGGLSTVWVVLLMLLLMLLTGGAVAAYFLFVRDA